MLKQIDDAVRYIQKKTSLKPRIGIVLGSGLGPFAKEVQEQVVIPYSEIPHMVSTTVEGHEGRLILGMIRDVPVAIMQGRLHLYEGYSMTTIVFPTRILGGMGVRSLILTNAAGGINLSFRPGDLMVITDHINMMGDNPLRGPNPASLGPRFPDMTHAYHPGSVEILVATARELGFELKQGVYTALSGPTYETPAEVRMLRTLGSDAVGMSTVPESIAANHLGIRVCGVSCITNLAAGITGQKLTHDEVKEVANRTMERFVGLLRAAVPKLDRV